MSDLVEVAYVADEHQALMIQALLEENEIPSLQQQVTPSGPQLGYGLMNLGGGSRRLFVHADRAEEASALVAGALAESEGEIPESINARYLEDAGGRKPRNYGLIGASARIYLGFDRGDGVDGCRLRSSARSRSHVTAIGPRTISRR